MATFIEPESFVGEERLRIPVAGQDRCIVVSGMAVFSTGHTTGDGEHHPVGSQINGAGLDKRWWKHSIRMVVGPEFSQVKDVSPIVAVAGYFFEDSDETDSTGFELGKVSWDAVSSDDNQNMERVRLKFSLSICGGEQSSITRISYHFVVTGTVNAATG